MTGVLDTPVGRVPRVSTELTPPDRIGAWKVRWGIGRDSYTVDPGLYAVGAPGAESPVLVTANYKLTFDALRRELTGLDAWVLALDTRGVNVWCAAGKGTFSTAELTRRVNYADLAGLVSHGRLIVPQLGAPGVAAHLVRARTGFRVVWGPIRAEDIPAFLAAGMKATPEMREVTFTLAERLVLAPVELVGARKLLAWLLAAYLALTLLTARPLLDVRFVLAQWLLNASPVLLGVLAGAVLTPILLPWVPGRAFAAKGAIVGLLAGAGAAWALRTAGVIGVGGTVAFLLLTPAVASFVAMNFTGSTPYTSLSGVDVEMRRWIPLQLAGAGLALVVPLLLHFLGPIAGLA